VNWVGAGEFQHILEFGHADAGIGREALKDLFAVPGAFLVKEKMFLNELADLPGGAHLLTFHGVLSALLPKRKGLPYAVFEFTIDG